MQSLTDAREAHDAARRDADAAPSTDRAAAENRLADAQLRLEEAERRQRDDQEAMIAGGSDNPATEKRAQLAEARIRMTYGRGGAIGRESITVTEEDPELAEARAANAQNEALSAALAQERAERKADAERQAVQREAEMNEAARLYEGLPQHRGLDRADYIQRENDWKQYLDEHPERRAILAGEAREAYAMQRAQSTGIPHREAGENEQIAGKIVGARRFEGIPHLVVESAGQNGTERIIVAGEMRNAALYRDVSICTDSQRRLIAHEDSFDRDPGRDR